MADRGRPTKLTPETITKLTEAIKQGATYLLACKYAGISYAAFAEWQARGREEIERRANPRVKPDTTEWQAAQPFVDFLESIQKAEGEAVVGWLKKIEAAAGEQWQAAAWKLERRYPRDYGRTVTEQEPAMSAEQIAQMSDDELDAYIAKLNKLSTR